MSDTGTTTAAEAFAAHGAAVAAFADDVRTVTDDLAALLIAKNQAYGNSALDPVRIFSRADVVEQLLVRIDDKLSRLARGSVADEDVERDLMGYLVLLRVARKRAAAVVGGAP